MRNHPVRIVLLIAALAFAPNLIAFLGSLYAEKPGATAPIAASSAGHGEKAAPRAETALPGAGKAAPARTESLFMAVPGRLLIGSLAERGLAAALQEMEMNEMTLNAAAQRQPWPGRGSRPPEARSRPDSSNLAQETGDTETIASAFNYKIDQSLWPSSTIVVLLHGAGGNETTLIPFARSIWPHATLIGIRGRIVQGKEQRWYHKITPTSFDRQEAEREAARLARFIMDMAYRKHYALHKIIFVGYSNGANILAIMAVKYPQLVQRAILLRPMPVLETMPQVDLHNLHILTLSGARDKIYGGFAEPLHSALQQAGAQVASHRLDATHKLSREDAKFIRIWLESGS